HDERRPPGRYALLGYPCHLTKPDHENRVVESVSYPYYTSLYEHDRGPLEYDFGREIAMNLQEPSGPVGPGFGFRLPHGSGLSGSGMWRVMDEAAPLDRLSWEDMKLIGIAHTWDPGPQVIKGTRIKFALQLIHTGWPELRPEIDRHFPYPSLC